MRASTAPQPTGHAYLKASFQIGSIKGPTSYDQTTVVFHPDDIPAAKVQNKKDVKAWKKERSKGLGTSARWDMTVENPDPIPQRRIRTCAEHDRPNMYQYNYRAEVLPTKNLAHLPKPHKFKIDMMDPTTRNTITMRKAADPVLGGNAKRTEEMPVNPKLADKLNWNQSTEFTKKEYKTRWDRSEDARTQNSVKKNAKLKRYVSPEAREAARRAELRRLKESGVVPAYNVGPTADDIPRYNRLAKEPSVKTKSSKHSGAWEFNKLEDQWMWSDTASFEKASPGDMVKIHNPCAFNFASPTSV